MKLNLLFKNAPEIEIEQLSTDSRLPMKNAIFFCLSGIKYDGHKYIDDAIDNGAKVIVYSKEIEKNKGAIYIKVKNVNETLYRIADIFYDHPNNGINKYLITGCYGRSSVSEIIKHYLNKISTCGSVGIFGINYKDRHLSTTFPALTPLENLKTLDNFKKNNISNITFESSTISLYYKKLDVVKPNILIYTNTSKYCSDYKVCNNRYFEYVRRYLYTLEDNISVLLNIDDISFNEFNDCVNNYFTYGKDESADYSFKDICLTNNGCEFTLIRNSNEYHVSSKLLSESNIYNLVAAIAALNIEGYDIQDIINNIKDIDYIDGVLERIDDNFNIIIDCGYELDSIKSTMEYARKTCSGRLIGLLAINYSDSDKTIKEELKYCEENLDVIILTEDETLEGETMSILSRANKYSIKNNIVHIPYRSVAIENAINIMNENDTLLIMGKGNEKYLNMGLGKERYLGDKHYAIKYMKKRKTESFN